MYTQPCILAQLVLIHGTSVFVPRFHPLIVEQPLSPCGLDIEANHEPGGEEA